MHVDSAIKKTPFGFGNNSMLLHYQYLGVLWQPVQYLG